MKIADATPGRLTAGVALGLLVAALAVQTYLARTVSTFGDAASARTALVSLGALADAIEAAGLDSPELQSSIESYDKSNEAVSSIRVIHLRERRLLASTAPDDVGDRAAPRRLARPEKAIWDLGQSLRANSEANADEGRKWKEEVSVETAADRQAEGDDSEGDPAPEESAQDPAASEVDDSVLYLAAPIEVDGQVAGTVLIEARPEPAPIEAPGLWGMAAALCLLPALAVFLLGRWLPARRLPERRLLVALAAAIFLASLWIYGSWAQGVLLDGRGAVETVMAERLEQEASRVGASLGTPAEATWTWDMDLFREPLGLQTAEGIDRDGLAAELEEEAGTLARLLWVSGALALLLAAFVGLGGAHATGRTLVTHREAYSYVLPAMLGMIALVFLPFFYGVLLSFTNQSIYNTDQPLSEIWVGLENFEEILTDVQIFRDTEEGRQVNYQNFYWTLGFTVVWTVTNVAFGVSMGLVLALILNLRGFRIRGIYRVLLILPWAMPNYITALIWKGMFHSQFGVINQVIQMFGGEAVSWFDTPFTSFITVISTNGWLSFPFMMVISLGALQSIPADLYEAARVDGASRWQQFRSITWPSLAPAMVPAIILSVVWTFNMFNIIYLVSGGAPQGKTDILITEAFRWAFERGQGGA
ncbi:MAG: sugar ABC transporter permease, partial [Holophagales bacterium]|nr:sugar ABC transporter permease [Holophagales bacterium]